MRARGVEARGGWWWFELSVDASFLLDVVFNFFTAFSEGEARDHEVPVMVYSPRRIAVNYLTGWCFVDVTSSLPWELIISGLSSLRAAKVLKLGRVLKVAKMLRFSKIMRFSQERATELEELLLSASTASLIKLLTLVVLVCVCVIVR